MLELSHVSKTFNAGTVNEKRALCDLSLTLADGEFATIVGSNGAGKSTLFNAIAGMFYVDDGILRLDGRDITFLPSHKRSRRICARRKSTSSCAASAARTGNSSAMRSPSSTWGSRSA
mgnify:CR=1 FL=1